MGIDDELRSAVEQHRVTVGAQATERKTYEEAKASFIADETAVIDELEQAAHRVLELLDQRGNPGAQDVVAEKKWLGKDRTVRGWPVPELLPGGSKLLALDGTLYFTAGPGQIYGHSLPLRKWIANEVSAAHRANDNLNIYEMFFGRESYSHFDRQMRARWPEIRAKVMGTFAAILSRAGVDV